MFVRTFLTGTTILDFVEKDLASLDLTNTKIGEKQGLPSLIMIRITLSQIYPWLQVVVISAFLINIKNRNFCYDSQA